MSQGVRKLTVLVAVVVLLFSGVATAPMASSAQPQILTYGMRLEPKSFDPAGGNEQYTLKVIRNAYEALIQEKFGTTQLEPALAESWTVSPDNMTWTFKLRRSVKFHDGSGFNAEAVKFTFDRLKKVPIGVHRLVAGAEVRIVDPYTIQIVLKAPDVYFP
jgi:peptide/nickel transport system substrate-binding protein